MNAIRLPLVTALFAVLSLGCADAGGDGTPLVLGDHRYEVRVVSPTGLTAGGDATLELQIRPKGERKLSLEFPTRLELETNDLVNAPARLDKEAATLFTEPAIDFAIPVRGLREGAGDLSGRLRVGVCTGDLCEPVELPFVTAIRVQP